jgi:hypothetical protein
MLFQWRSSSARSATTSFGVQDSWRSASGAAFSDLLGLGPGGPSGFGAINWPDIAADFDDSIVPAQIQAVAELYFIYQHERMGVFRVVDMLRRLFHEGRMKVHRGPGARGLYLLDKWQPLRYGPRDRLAAYMRVFNYGRAPRPPGAIVNVNFHFQLVALMTALAQYFRDLTISEVIKGGQTLDHRPFGTLAACTASAATCATRWTARATATSSRWTWRPAST